MHTNYPFTDNRSRYRTPITSASVFDTLLEGPRMSFAILGNGSGGDSKRGSSTSESSSTESLRNGLYFMRNAQPDNDTKWKEKNKLFSHTVSSNSTDQSCPIGSVAAALQTDFTDQIDNEPITWNYNPHAIAPSNNKTKPNHKDHNLSYNC